MSSLLFLIVLAQIKKIVLYFFYIISSILETRMSFRHVWTLTQRQVWERGLGDVKTSTRIKYRCRRIIQKRDEPHLIVKFHVVRHQLQIKLSPTWQLIDIYLQWGNVSHLIASHKFHRLKCIESESMESWKSFYGKLEALLHRKTWTVWFGPLVIDSRGKYGGVTHY